MSQTLTTDAPQNLAELGKWVTRCGPKKKASTFGLVISLVGDKELSFESKVDGDPDRVINTIARSAPDVEEKEISLG